MRLYIFGPMVQHRDTHWNRPRFEEARTALIASGHEVCSPMMVDDGLGGPDATGRHFSYAWLISLDVQVLSTCEAIVLVDPDWQESRGSRVEAFMAVTFGIPVLRYPDLQPVPPSELASAFLRIFDATPEAERPVVALIAAERARQDKKWGEQNHPDGTGLPGDLYEANLTREMCQEAGRQGKDTWRLIAMEEQAEARAEADPVKLEKELVQSAAVDVAWVECIRRRRRLVS